MAKKSDSGGRKRTKPSTGKRFLFQAVTVVLFFALLELLLALFGVDPVVVEEDPYVGFSSSLKLFQPTGGGYLKTARNKLALFNDQSFPAEKERGTVRIFTLGGSVTYGRPFDDRTSYTGWLRTYLEAIDPDTRWEVINAGGISYASYRVATLMEELALYDPDLFVIYSGNNEFLERRTYSGIIAEPQALTRTKELLQRSRIWALGSRLSSLREERARRRYELTGEVEELLDTSAGLNYYFRDEPFKRQVLDHYRYNLQRMVRLARSAGAAVLLVSIPVNEKDFSPFKSQHRDGMTESDQQRHEELLEETAVALERGDDERARDHAREAVELDPLHADGHYLLGRARLAAGQTEEAAESFARAIAEDVCPLRALEETNRLILEAAQRDSVPLVDYRKRLREEAVESTGHRLLGDEFFLDHVHLTVEANGIAARALVEAMADLGMVELGDDWHDRVGDQVRGEVLGRVNAEVQAEAYKNLSKVLIWAGKKREAEKYVQLAAEVLGDDWEVHYNAALVHLEDGEVEEAIAELRESITLYPESAMAHDQLAVAYAASSRLDEAVAAGRQAVALDPDVADYWNNLATFYTAAGDADKALEAADRALVIDPGFAEAHNNRGKILFDLERHDEAIAAFDRAMGLRPSYLEAMHNRGLVLAELGRFEEALEAFDAVLAVDPGETASSLARARVLLAGGDLEGGRTALRSLLASSPLEAGAWELLASSYAGAGDRAQARAVLDEGIGALSGSEPALSAPLLQMRGRLLAQEGRFEEAAAAFEDAGRRGLLAARIDLGNLYIAQRRPQEAIRVYRRILADHPDDDRVHHLLAIGLLIVGQVAEATTHLETALQLWPDNAAAMNDLATVYERTDRLQEALGLYRRAAALDPSLDAAREGASRLEGRLESR